MNENALSYIQSKGLEFKAQAGEIVLQTCPFCQDKKGHFYMDPGEGLFFCHKCNQKGNLVTLQKHFGDRPMGSTRPLEKPFQKGRDRIAEAFPKEPKAYPVPDQKRFLQAHERLLNDHSALAYVTETRGLSEEAIKHFQLGFQLEQDGTRWLTIPHYKEGRLLNVKFRSLPPAEKDFKRVEGCRSILFNGDVLKENPEEVFITEGELDAITLWDRGLKKVVSGTTGAGSFEPSWIDQLEKVKKIILCYDPDEAGQKGAREVARRLGFDRCFNVVLPFGYDANEFFMAGFEVSDFNRLVEDAKPFDVAGIMSFHDAVQEFKKESARPERATGIKTGWPSVDKLVKTGLRPGELVVLSATPKIGKSTFALQILTRNALDGIPSLFYCLEMRPCEIVKKIVECYTRKEEPDPSDIERAEQAFENAPLFLGYSWQRPTLDGIMDTLKAAVKRYGLRLLCFDHLHKLCRSLSNQVQEVGLAVQDFKFLAEEMEIPVILIAQPRKVEPDSIMTAMDLKDSASIYSDCDHLIILHRKRIATDGKEMPGKKKKKDEGGEGLVLKEQAFHPMTLVRLEASRYNEGGETLLYYHGGFSRFDEMAAEGRA